MSRNRIYQIHQAFNDTYNRQQIDPELPEVEFAASLAFHHAPEKLAVFKDYRGYGTWFTTLYNDGIKVREALREIYYQAEKAESSWYNSKKPLNEILKLLWDLEKDISDFRTDAVECQLCYLAGDIIDKHGYVNSLSDLIWELDGIVSRIHITLNRKLTEISTLRMTLIGLAVGVMALVTSVISVYISVNK